jgi:hypothetical protein
VLEKKRQLSRSNPEFEDSKNKEKENANLWIWM